jgi:hypothetical protein
MNEPGLVGQGRNGDDIPDFEGQLWKDTINPAWKT